MAYPTPQELWNMNSSDFNAWRKANDLKNLFKVFESTLPSFDKWLATYEFTIDFILETDQPGQFFYGEKENCLIETLDKKIFFIYIEDEKHKKQIENNKTDESKKIIFKPYLKWAKEVLKTDKIIKTAHSGELDTFRYVGGTAPDVPDMCSAIIAPGITVLKLGGVQINGWMQIINRNLDFTNLDFLVVEGKNTWSHGEKNIYFSTCRNLSLKNTEADATKFYGCHFENLKVFDSSLHWIEFTGCDMFKGYFENSRLSDIFIENSSINRFSFNRVEVENIIYTPPEKEWHCGKVMTYETVKDNFKRFRVLYQSNGLRQEASEAYYYERFFELKYIWGSIGFINILKRIGKTSRSSIFFGLKTNFRKLVLLVGQVLSYLIWGFGEKPKRIFFASVSLMTIYSVIYYVCLYHKVVSSVYLSVIIFSTLGFGNYEPIDQGYFKLIVASEALIGAFFLGLFVAGYANKSKY